MAETEILEYHVLTRDSEDLPEMMRKIVMRGLREDEDPWMGSEQGPRYEVHVLTQGQEPVAYAKISRMETGSDVGSLSQLLFEDERITDHENRDVPRSDLKFKPGYRSYSGKGEVARLRELRGRSETLKTDLVKRIGSDPRIELIEATAEVPTEFTFLKETGFEDTEIDETDGVTWESHYPVMVWNNPLYKTGER